MSTYKSQNEALLSAVIMDTLEPKLEFGPWNPGIDSTLPREFLPLSTLFRPENVSTNLADLHELSDFSGISLQDLVVFKPERLLVHELLIRVTADLSVPDGTKYEDLGTNFRRMTATILSKHILPQFDEIKQVYDNVRREISVLIEQELSTYFRQALPPPSRSPERRGLIARFGFGAKPEQVPAPLESAEERDLRIMTTWSKKGDAAESELERKTYQALVRMASAVGRKRGRLIGDARLLSALAMPAVCNEYGSEVIGSYIEPYFRRAASEEGYGLLPSQAHPVVMNVKGASASGKSTMRPLQKQLAERLGIRWDEFALISPDIWRKFLLDYGSLGPARRYAGTLTGHEVAIIDKKLDRYMANKGEKGRMSHLLIDRFRFDSFATGTDKEDGSGLLTRFGHLVYMFFMITPPEATVERAWTRGEQFGRYKAVDDLLHHNIEAYTGMPRLFFTWAGKQDKKVHFEFLDNSVLEGRRPRTVAFGTDGEMNILDVKRLIDIDRFRKINLDARRPEDVYDADSLAPEKNTEFLRQCARTIPAINFVDYESGSIYAQVRGGTLTCGVEGPHDPDTKAGLAAVAAELSPSSSDTSETLGSLTLEQAHTLGAWGAGATSNDEISI
jgi:hypothetical protein